MSPKNPQDSLPIVKGDRDLHGDGGNSNKSRSDTGSEIDSVDDGYAVWICVLLVPFLVGVLLLASCITLVLLSCMTLVPIIAMPLLIVSFLVTRLLQFIRCGDSFNRLIQLKFLILIWLWVDLTYILMSKGIFFPIAKYVPGLKHVMLLGLPLTNWVKITSMMCGFFIFSCALSRLLPVKLREIKLKNIECVINIPEAASEIIQCLILWWAELELIKRVPTFKQHQILDLETWKWIGVAIFSLVGHNGITLFTHVIVWLLQVGFRALSRRDEVPNWYLTIGKLLHTKHWVYCASGLRRSVSFILSSVLLLLIWELYVGSHLKRTAQAKHVLEIGTRTLVSLLICSLLWLIKTFVLLAWEENAIYNRLDSTILENGQKLYFLGLVGRHKYDIFNLLYEDEPIEIGLGTMVCRLALEATSSDNKFRQESDEHDVWGRDMKKLSSQRKQIVKDDLLKPRGWTPTLHDIQQVAQYLLAAKDALSRDKYASDLLQYLKSNNPSGNNNGVNVDDLKWLINGGNSQNDAAQDSSDQPSSKEDAQNVDCEVQEEMLGAQHSSDHPSPKEDENSDWEVFKETVQKVDSSTADEASGHNPNTDRVNLSEKIIPFEKIQKWMENAQQGCLFVANTVMSGKEVVDCLNTIISGVLIGATFIMWLLLTGLASTRVLVIIASPLLAATFIFGETCKNLFQGIIFVYVVHPFDVGDKCDIGEDKELLVKTIGVWKTTFLKGNTTVEVIYPNSELAKQKVTNYKIKLDWLEEHAKEKDQKGEVVAERNPSHLGRSVTAVKPTFPRIGSTSRGWLYVLGWTGQSQP